MNPERIKRLLKKVKHSLKFKEATATLPDNLFEAISVMLNRMGPNILEVNDAGDVMCYSRR